MDLIKSKFDIKGWTLLTNFLTPEEHEYYLDICDHILLNRIQPSYKWALNSNGTINKLHGACETVPAFRKLASHPSLIRQAKSLLPFEEEMDIYISKFFPMQPKAISTLMHQDNYFFRGDPQKILSCAVYLQNTSTENGCLRVVEGSHLRGIFPHNIDEEGIAQWIDQRELTDYKIIELNLKAPYAVFFNINLVHGCSMNMTDSTRYSLAWEYVNKTDNNLTVSAEKWCDRISVL